MVLPATGNMTVFTTNYSVQISRGEEANHRTIPLKNKEEFDTVKKLCEDTTNMMTSQWKALLVPTRTDFATLASDLFSPTLFHLIFKSKEAVENGKFFLVIGGIFAFAIDMATLPLRLITLIPRAIYNHYASVEHPLIPYLKGKGIPETLQKGILGICLITEERKEWLEKGKGFFASFDLPHSASKEDTITYHREIADREIPFPECLPPTHSDTGTHGFAEYLK